MEFSRAGEVSSNMGTPINILSTEYFVKGSAGKNFGDFSPRSLKSALFKWEI